MVIPEELQKALKINKKAKEKFEKLPPSHQKEYIVYITSAKKPETRERRVKKTIEMLLN